MYNKKFILLTILFSLISGLYIYNHRLDLNPDAVSYFDIAKFYKVGDLKSAINAYWSPLFSWFLTILNFTGNWLFTSKIAIFLSSLFWFISSFCLTQTIFKNYKKSLLIVFILVIFPGSYEIWRLITPDLIFAGFINIWLIYLIKLINKLSTSWFKFGLFTGVGFLIKSFLLSYSVIFFGILLIFRYINFKSLFYYLFGLLIIASIWGLIIFQKYHHFSFSTSVNVTYKHHVLSQQFIFLLKPIIPLVGTSFWTDPSDFSIFNIDNIKQINILIINLIDAGKFLIRNFHIGLLLIIFQLFQKRKNNEFIILFILIISWIGIYGLIFIEPRYLWPLITPLLILIFYKLNTKIFQYLYIIFFVITLALFIKTYIRYLPTDENSVLHLNISQQIKLPCTLLSDVWDRGLYISYLSGCKYYGISETVFSDQNIKNTLNQELITDKVNYFLTFNNTRYSGRLSNLKPDYSWNFYGKNIVLYKFLE